MKFSRQELRIYGVSVLVRLLVLSVLVLPNLSLWEQRFGVGVPGGGNDDISYYKISKILAEEHYFAELIGGTHVSIYRTPLYTMFLAVAGKVSDFDPLLMTVFQILVVAIVPLVFRRILQRLKLPLWPAWLLVFDPLTVIMGISLMTESLLSLLLLLAFYFWLDSEKPLSRYFSLSLLALAALTKPTVLYLLPVLVGAMLWQYKKRRHTFAAAALAMVFVLAWMGRNYHVAGLFTMSTQSENSVLVVKTVEAIKAGIPESQVLPYIAEKWIKETGRHPYEMITDNKLDFSGQAVAFVLKDPVTIVWFELKGAVRLLFGTGRAHLRNTFFPGQDIGMLRYYDLAMIGYYGVLYGMMVLTIRPMKILKTPWLLAAWLLIAYTVALMALFSWTTGGALKRAPVIPFMYLVAAGQSAFLWSRWKLKKSPRTER
jgi:hypothetical protein